MAIRNRRRNMKVDSLGTVRNLSIEDGKRGTRE